MKRSVAMASYNGARYIEEQLRSVLSQLGPQDEVVVSDDGSTDGTRALLETLAGQDSRLRVLSGPGKGVVRNFEHALAAVTGDIVFLCDQDDVWQPDKVAAVSAAFDDPAVWLVMHDARVTDDALRPVADSFFALHGSRAGYYRNLWRNSYIGCCMAFRRELLSLALPFPEGIPMHDQWLGMLANRRGGVRLLARPLIDYRRHAGTATTDRHGTLTNMLRNRWVLWRALGRRWRETRGLSTTPDEQRGS